MFNVVGPEAVKSLTDHCHILERTSAGVLGCINTSQNVHFAVTTSADVKRFFSQYN